MVTPKELGRAIDRRLSINRIGVLVTGGAGYIGSHLVNALQREGYTVRVLDLKCIDGDQFSRTTDFIRGSVTDRSLVSETLREIDVVCHLAWAFHVEDVLIQVEENLLGTLNLLEASQATGIKQFVFASSAVVYGPTGLACVDEDYPCHPERSTIGGPLYGVTKFSCEQYCLSYQHRGLPVTILRIHGVFNEGRLGQFEEMVQCASMGDKVKVVRGAGGEYIHLDDVTDIFRLVIGNQMSFGQVFNVAGLYCYQDSDLARQIVEMTGVESEVELIDDPGQRMISASVDKLNRVLGYRFKRGEFLTGLVRARISKSKEAA